MSDVHANTFAAEQIAIGATNALEASRVSLRGYRDRPLLPRAIDALTGNGRAHLAAIGSDLRATQQATLDAVSWIMEEEARTQGCLARVADAVHRFDAELSALDAIVPALRRAVRSLDDRLSSLAGVVDREIELRRLKEAYSDGRFQPGAGPLLQGAFLIAHVDRLFAAEADAARQHERETILGLVGATLRDHGWDTAPPQHLLLSAAEDVTSDALLLVTSSVEGTGRAYSATVAELLTRRLADSLPSVPDAETALRTARYRFDFRDAPADALLQPHELAGRLADELVAV